MANIAYYRDAPPDATTIAIIEGRGDTWSLIDRPVSTVVSPVPVSGTQQPIANAPVLPGQTTNQNLANFTNWVNAVVSALRQMGVTGFGYSIRQPTSEGFFALNAEALFTWAGGSMLLTQWHASSWDTTTAARELAIKIQNSNAALVAPATSQAIQAYGADFVSTQPVSPQPVSQPVVQAVSQPMVQVSPVQVVDSGPVTVGQTDTTVPSEGGVNSVRESILAMSGEGPYTFDEWNWFYAQVSGNPGPAPEDRGVTREQANGAWTFDQWFAAAFGGAAPGGIVTDTTPPGGTGATGGGGAPAGGGGGGAPAGGGGGGAPAGGGAARSGLAKFLSDLLAFLLAGRRFSAA